MKVIKTIVYNSFLKYYPSVNNFQTSKMNIFLEKKNMPLGGFLRVRGGVLGV